MRELSADPPGNIRDEGTRQDTGLAGKLLDESPKFCCHYEKRTHIHAMWVL